MEENQKLTEKVLIEYLTQFRGKELSLQEMMKDLQIMDERQGAFRKMLSLLANKKEERVIKSVGSRSGLYKVLREIKPITTLGDFVAKPIEIVFPYGYDDTSTFGFEDTVEIDEGDIIVIAGVSNSAKTGFIINMLSVNMDKFPCLLMGNEYARDDNQLSPKFVRRMKRMSWANWENGDGKLKFEILPIDEDYEEWVEPGKINFIDWISLEDKFFDIGRIIKAIKRAVGTGVGIVVIQKDEESLLGRGKAFSKDLADFYITIDPMGQFDKRVTVIKAKAPSGAPLDYRTWGFQLVEGGTKFHNIREIVKCNVCYGKKWRKQGNTSVPCDECDRTGYKDKRGG